MENQEKDNRPKKNPRKRSITGSNEDIAVNKLLDDLKIHKDEYEQQQEELSRIRLELEQTKDKFSDMFDFAPTGYFTLGNNAQIILVNLTGAKMLDSGREEILNKSFYNYVTPSHHDYFKELFNRASSQALVHHAEITLITIQGNELHVAIELLCIDLDHGQDLRIRLSVIDLTEKHEKDGLIEFSQANLRALLDSSAQAIFLLGPGFELLRFNQIAFDQMRLMMHKELSEGDNILEYISDLDKDTFIENFNKALTGTPTKKEKHLTFPSNPDNWTELRYIPMYNNTGDIIGVAFSILDITQRKKAEEELQPAKEQARLLLSLVPSAIFTIDSNLIITSWNKRAEEITGYIKEEVIGNNCHQLMISSCHDGCGLFDKEIATPAFGKECTITTKSGEKRIIVKNFDIVRNPEGQIIEGIESFEDITEKRRIEMQALDRNKRIIKFQEALLSITKEKNFILETDLKRILSITANALNIERVSFWQFSNDMEQIRCDFVYSFSGGLSFCEDKIFVSDSPAYFESILKERTLSVSDVTSDVRTKDFAGTYFLPLGITSVLDVPVRIKGKVAGILCNEHIGDTRDWLIEEQEFAASVSDLVAISIVADRHSQAEEKLRTSEELYHKLVSASPDAITLTDFTGKLTYVSSMALQMFGFSNKEEVLGRNVWEFVHPDESERAKLHMQLVANGGKAIDTQYKFLRQDGSIFFGEMKSTIITDISEKKPLAFLTITRDITSRKSSEEKLVQSEHQLREANATKDKFFSIIAHDLRSPFNSLIGFSELLYEDYDQFEESEIKEFINQIYISSVNSLKLLDNLLQWAKSQTGGIMAMAEQLEIANLVLETIGLLKSAANSKRIKIRTDLQQGCIAFADGSMIRTILRNLVSNAIKFTYPEGEIKIKSTILESNVRIEVSDNGMGIREIDQELIFKVDQKFRSLGTANEQGTGLGLILCKEFVEKNGGEIGLESFEGKGSTFFFTLPRA
jgi:two-component system, sensor histidine kinase and response regulator